MKAQIGVIGLGVMGKSLCRNLGRNGFAIAMFNRFVPGKEEGVAKALQQAHPELSGALHFENLKDFVQSIAQPRKIILMVNAGPAVDDVLGQLSSILDEDDVVLDGGNSHYEDTLNRIDKMKKRGIHFMGAGISGGEKGALTGPSIMPSGDPEAYQKMEEYLNAIAAKDKDGKPCSSFVGQQGSGHYVKMIHNGIEYVEMQLLAECYALLKHQGNDNSAIADIFESWENDLGSYLLKITVNILRKKENSSYVLDQILDKANNKGTGLWSTTAIAQLGEPSTLIPAALFARYLSFFKKDREVLSRVYPQSKPVTTFLEVDLKAAYQFSRLINHHQGFSVIEKASRTYAWGVKIPEIARIWTAGCIITSDLMKSLVVDLKTETSIIHHVQWQSIIKYTAKAARTIAAYAIQNEIHAPCILEAINFFHGIKTRHSSANLIQAQRDFFGAHTYQKVNDKSGKRFHTLWEKD